MKRSVYPPQAFGEYDYELDYLKDERIHRELKGTADQIVGWNRIALSVPPPLRRTAQVLQDHLTEAQAKRFHELMIRRRLFLGGIEATLGYPVVVEKLKLTGAQLEALRAGAAANDILTADQEKLRVSLLGEPFEFDGVATDEVFDAFRKARAEAARPKRAAGQPLRPLEDDPMIARSLLLLSGRLEMSDAQIKQLREIAEDFPKMQALIQKELGYPDGQHSAGADRGQWSFHAVQAKYREGVEARCWKVLDPKQQSRAKEMMGQMAGRKK